MYLGRDDFAGSIDLFRREEIRPWKHLKTRKFISLFQILFRFKDDLYAANPVRKPVAWQESTTLTLSTAERSQQVSIGAFVVPRWMAANHWLYKSFLIFSLCFFCVYWGIKQNYLKGCLVFCVFCTFSSHYLEEKNSFEVPPASLTQLLVSEWDSGAASPVPLQPTFSVSYGFESAETENLVLRSVQILYEVEVRSPEILVQAEAESGLYALTVDGLPKTSTLVTVPQDMPRIITIQARCKTTLRSTGRRVN